MSAYTTFQEDTSNTSTIANFTGLDNGKYYQFRVSAVNSEGSGIVAESNVVLLSGPPGAVTNLIPTIGGNSVSLSWIKPALSGGKIITDYEIKYLLLDQAISDPPASLQAEIGNQKCVLSWNIPTDFGYSDITGYIIEKADNANYDNWAQGLVVSTTTTNPYPVTGLSNNTTYKFRVSAINGIGTSEPATTSIVTPQPVVPNAPTGLTVTPGDESFFGTWSIPTDTGGSDITGYVLMHAESDSDSFNSVTLGNITSYTVVGLTNGDSYKFKVSAINGVGTGPSSDISPFVTPTSIILPSKPTGVSGTPDHLKVSLSWTASNDNGGPSITNYKIEYKQSDVSSWPASPDFVLVGDASTSKDVTGLTNGTAYNFRVYGITSNGTGPASDETSGITPINTFSISSTGGIVTTYTSNSIDYTVYEFRYTGGTSGTQTEYTFTVSGSKAAEVFIVGGGGCGGSDGGGGGGGGGVVYDPNITLGAGDYTVKVGNGGDINDNRDYFGEKGSDSEIITNPTTAITTNLTLPFKGKGGGAGYPRNKDGENETDADGGSGGGADHAGSSPFPRPAGDSDQGNTYWNGSSWVAGGHSGGESRKGGAGGGGAGGAAPNQPANQGETGSRGGHGVDNNWLGDDNGNNKGTTGWRNYAAGGGGGHWNGVGGEGGQSASNSSVNTKGSGGGGRGGGNEPTPVRVSGNSHNSEHGKEHRGGGGGGEGHENRGDEGNGGSGIVLIRYVTS